LKTFRLRHCYEWDEFEKWCYHNNRQPFTVLRQYMRETTASGQELVPQLKSHTFEIAKENAIKESGITP